MTNPLSLEQIQQTLVEIPGWQFNEGKLARHYRFKNFVEALAFVNQVGAVAEAQEHHPDIHLTQYNQVALVLNTHDAAGQLTGKDVALAKALNLLIPS